MTDRVACKSPGCTRTILPATAARTDGYCMPCVQEKAHREHQEYVRKNRRDVNPYEGVDDPQELIKLAHVRRNFDPLIRYLPCPRPLEELYAELDAARLAELTQHASDILERGDTQQAEAIARCLTAFTDADINSLLSKFLAADEYCSGCIFLRANSDIRDRLIAGLHSLSRTEEDSQRRNQILLALAWIGDARVVELFAGWRTQPPAWADTLYVPPENYSVEAGWTLSADGQRLDLFSRTCYALVPTEDEALLAITLTPAQLGIPALPGPVAIPLYESDRPDAERLLCCKLVPASVPRSAWHALDQFVPTAAVSQIGGHPTWIQDAEYPQCPVCKEMMFFVGQVAMEELRCSGVGTHFAFICVGCGTTATRYQCT